jgi:ABC-type cobalt transport system substrate-binding protein
LNHLKENFQLQSKEFKVLEPFIDPIFEENSGSSISLNGVEVGEISLLYNSNFGESSLIYFSPSGLIESLVFNFEDFYEYTVSDYLLIIYELTGIIESQLKLYKNEE